MQTCKTYNSFLKAQSYITCKGIVPLDDTTVDKVICHHSACLVLFHHKYGYGMPEKEFEQLGELAAANSEVLIAEIGTTDWGDTENHYTRKKYDVALADYPSVLLFTRKRPPIKYRGEITKSNIVSWLMEKTGVLLENETSLAQIQHQARRFMKIYLDQSEDDKQTEVEKMITKTEDMIGNIRTDSDKALCKVYIQVMKKVLAKGRDYISNEPLRLRNLIRRGQVSEEKKIVFQQKIDVLKSFKKYMEEENH
uniref:Uncharacterized protein n=1 Tax=Clytia hemisphaerica TaxID=252671 RepID=A0A7M5X0B6_9CNID